MKRHALAFCVALLSLLVGGEAIGGVYSGVTRELTVDPMTQRLLALGGVTVEARAVDVNGNVTRTPFRTETSDPKTGEYSIDVSAELRVVLVFSAPGRKTVFVPGLPDGSGRTGGAISGQLSVKNFDVIVPRQTASNCCNQTNWQRSRRCRRW